MKESLPGSPVLTAEALADHVLRQGVGLFPTDTLPALAALPASAHRIWTLKARPANKPLILMGADPAPLLASLQHPLHPDWEAMARQVWPGPCTLVLPAAGDLLEQLHPQGSTVGLRIPAAAPALALLRLTGPLATTSANRSGEPPCQSAEQASEVFPDTPRLGPLPWPLGSGQASTVLQWTGPGAWQVLRSGACDPLKAMGSASP
jgi:L-threonylcarbamoyladenylate synthase